jgi:hypothetical protein
VNQLTAFFRPQEQKNAQNQHISGCNKKRTNAPGQEINDCPGAQLQRKGWALPPLILLFSLCIPKNA